MPSHFLRLEAFDNSRPYPFSSEDKASTKVLHHSLHVLLVIVSQARADLHGEKRMWDQTIWAFFVTSNIGKYFSSIQQR
jgi:hypothetical protein